ncbi:hypothetical protein [Neolewinella antarctica]|uniref:Uncharacterized protein n=1 Tax=Neolewinella antarctica TaxID=442734 RepID=A0ABX0XA70_9BACT|nr:hypothetical protein [Neolewinella antarctica]NJC26156.1 hypothetical protein [Neolewinella antarctica]
MPTFPLYREVYAFYLQRSAFELRTGAKAAHYRANLLIRVVSAGRSLLGNLIHWRRGRGMQSLGVKGKRWVVAGSRNEENTTAFLLADERYVQVPANVYQTRFPSVAVNWFPRPKMAYLGHYLPFFLRVFREQPSLFRYLIQILVHGTGCLENQRAVLREYRPELIVLSNDHYTFTRALAVAARLEGIPTVYLPHAPIVTDFPPLIFDLSLLEGEDSYRKYTDDGKEVRGEVRLIGSPKYDVFRDRVNQGSEIHRIGIPYGFFEDPAVVVETAKRILSAFPELTVTLRKHPRDERPSPATPPGIHWSDAKAEDALTYLSNQDVILATDTGIHLEAALMNVSSFYGPFLAPGRQLSDGYGFIENGLVEVVPTVEVFLAVVRRQRRDRPSVLHRADFYVKDAGGKLSSDLAFAAIDELATTSVRTKE